MAKAGFMEQTGQFFRKLTPIQIALIGVVVIGVITALVFLIMSASSKEMAVLYNSLEPGDASKIVEKLKEKQIEYELQDNGTTIAVDKNQLYQTRIDLASEGLPESSYVGYEIFDKTNLGMSEFVQKLNYRRALEGELSRTISALQEVKKVRVHIVIPEKALFDQDQKVPTASVSLTLSSGRSLNKINVEGIQNLVASSVEGMKPEHVNVIDQRGKILNEAPMDDKSISGLTSTQYEQQKKYEMYLSDKVQSMLAGVLGPGNSEVRVNAELDFTQKETTKTEYDPNGQVERSTQTVEDLAENYDSLVVNNPGGSNILESVIPYGGNKRNQTNSISNYELSRTVEHVIAEVGGIKRLSVAVMVNGKYNVTNNSGKQSLQYIPRSNEEMQKLNEIVRNAIGYDPTRNDQISVINVPFDSTDQESELVQSTEIDWWKNPDYQKLILLLVAMALAIFIMYRLLRSKEIADKMRYAYSLGDRGDIYALEHPEPSLDEIEIIDRDYLLLPADLPGQLLLEGDRQLSMPLEDQSEEMMSTAELAEKTKARLQEAPEFTENAIMKMEIKNKVQNYLNEQTDEGIRLIRMMAAQDNEDKSK